MKDDITFSELLLQEAFKTEWGKDISEPHCCENGERHLADTILALAMAEDLNGHSVSVLKQIYEALVAKDSEWRLSIRHSKRGKPVSRNEKVLKRTEDMAISRLVEIITERSGSRESAVSYVGEKHDMSRDAVFAAMRRAKPFFEQLAKKAE